MADAVTIANQALSRVGGQPITSFGDGTRSSNLVSLHYDQVVDDVLGSNNWTSAIFRQELSKLSEGPVSEFANAFQLPTDPYCLKVVSSSLDEFLLDYKIEGRTLVTDALNVTIKFIGRVADPEAFGPNVTKCIVALLAQRMAYDLTGPGGRSAELLDEYDFVWADAGANDGQQGSPDMLIADALIDVRN